MRVSSAGLADPIAPGAGNLLVLRDGRIGFIDFGIVGRIPPATWLALQSLAAAFQDSNFDLMAR